MSDFLKPDSRHTRSKSVPREVSSAASGTGSGSNRSRLWSKPFSRPRIPDPSSTFSSNQCYRHWVSFTHHGAYLLFIDHIKNEYQLVGNARSNIVLFSIDAKEHLKISSASRARGFRCLPGQLPPPKVIHHSNHPLLAFFFPRVARNCSVVLWDHFRAPDRLSTAYETSGFPGPRESIGDAHFSRDGNHLVIQSSTSQAPIVIPIHDDFLTEPEGSKAIMPQATQTSSNALTSKSGPLLRISNASSAPTGVFGSSTAITDSNSASGINIVHTGSHITLRKWSSEGERSAQETKSEILQLTRLPAWGALGSSSVAVRAPRAGDEKVRVVLNKSARQWDDMVHDEDMHLPALVSRDVASLQLENEHGEMRKLGARRDVLGLEGR